MTDNIWQRKHILDVDDFSREDLEKVLQTTLVMKDVLSRPLKKVPSLRGRIVANMFYEPSTRTLSSFELAAKHLSADVINLSAASSSYVKGESLIDTMSTLEALGADVVVMRHSQSGAPYAAARHLKGSMINAGDGWHAHPSQALLDLFTIRQYKGQTDGLKVSIIGDIKHSRVARSNIWSLTKMGSEVTICGPQTLLPNCLSRNGDIFPEVKCTLDIGEALADADVVMMLRLQKERQQSGLLPSVGEYIADYQLNEARLVLAKKDAIVMHPGPVNEDLEIKRDVAYGKQSVIQEQVTNGVATRMALLYLLCGREEI